MSRTEVLIRIIKEAQKWNGLKEIPGNLGWENKVFEEAMRDVGWRKHLAWCAFYTKMIYYKIFGNTEYGQSVLENFCGSATKTFENCKNDPHWTTDIENELAGCVVVWRKWNDGKPSWKGHIGIVIESGGGRIGSHFISLEGNTDKSGTRTGGMVAKKTRINNHGNKDGLVVEGFIFPPIPLEKLNSKEIELPYA